MNKSRLPHNSLCLAQSSANPSLSEHRRFIQRATLRCSQTTPCAASPTATSPDTSLRHRPSSASIQDRRLSAVRHADALLHHRTRVETQHSSLKELEEQLSDKEQEFEECKNKLRSVSTTLATREKELGYSKEIIELLHQRANFLEQKTLVSLHKLEELREMEDVFSLVAAKPEFESSAQALKQFVRSEETQMMLGAENTALCEKVQHLERKLKEQKQLTEATAHDVTQSRTEIRQLRAQAKKSLLDSAESQHSQAEREAERCYLGMGITRLYRKYRKESMDLADIPGGPKETLDALDQLIMERTMPQALPSSEERKVLLAVSRHTQRLWRKHLSEKFPDDMVRPLSILRHAEELISQLQQQLKVSQVEATEAVSKCEVAQEKLKESQRVQRTQAQEIDRLKRLLRQGS